MIRSNRLLASFAAAAFLAPVSAHAASDYLLELDGVRGESKTSIEVASWSLGASNPTSVGSSGMSAGRTVAPSTLPAADGSVRVVAPRDQATGQASGQRTACATGKHFPTAILSSRRSAWALTDVMVSSCTSDGFVFTYRSATPTAVPDAMKVTKSRSNIQNN